MTNLALRYLMKNHADANIRLLISAAGAALYDGETKRDMECPACEGGQTSERSFGLTRKENVLLYKCFRASCGMSGRVPVFGTLLDIKEKDIPKPDGRPYLKKLAYPTQDIFLKYREKYGILPEEIHSAQIKLAPEEGRVAFPVFSPTNYPRGWMLRPLNEESQYLKWDAFPDSGLATGPWISWHYSFATLGSKGPVVVVEDQISAIKVARAFRTCAILGTYLNVERIIEIADFAQRTNSPVVLALDKDATAKAIELIQEWKFFTGSRFSTVPIQKDLKYESKETIVNTIMSGVPKNEM